ncbi:MAG TPA: hypothetical protein VL295_09320 [Gemmatimonadales bacterium]|nr:hypothetical protein [Gemmatimonadales bacterium]
MLRSLRTALVSPAAKIFLAGAVQSLNAQGPQQAPALAPAVSTPAPAPASAVEPVAPTPRPSPLFEQHDDRAPTLAAAQKADAEARRSSGRHTVTMSTTVLILVVIILVLLID